MARVIVDLGDIGRAAPQAQNVVARRHDQGAESVIKIAGDPRDRFLQDAGKR